LRLPQSDCRRYRAIAAKNMGFRQSFGVSPVSFLLRGVAGGAEHGAATIGSSDRADGVLG